MDTDRIIARLASAERLPVGVIQTCLSNRDEVVPAFINLLRRCADTSQERPEEEDAIFLVVHILAELGEKQAFQPLLDLLSADQSRVERLLGDAVGENLPQILISTFDGNTERLYDVMNDPEVDEFVRYAVFGVWTYFACMGSIDREEARQYLLQGFETLQPVTSNHVWVAWVDAVARLGFEEMRDLVKQAFSEGRLPEWSLHIQDFEDELAAALAAQDREAWMRENRLYPFTDTVGVLSKWYGFSEDYIRKKGEYEREGQIPDIVTNPYRTVGRNDPCPCGSGKKFKHCCLH